MASTKDGLRALIEQRDALVAQLSALQGKIEGLEIAINIFKPDDNAPADKSEKFSLKAFILDLLKERGSSGLNATLAVELASARNVDIDRASVASLLSRLKHESVVIHDGALYKLKQFSIQAPTEIEKLETAAEGINEQREREVRELVFRKNHLNTRNIVLTRR